MNARTLAATVAAVGLLLSACAGADAAAEEEPRQVRITMGEMYFTATDTLFEVGVPYRFVLENRGRMAHEWAVVPRGEPDESNLLFEVEEDELPPGAVVEREFVFSEPGEYDISCFLPGHHEGNMILPIRVH